MSLLKQLLVSVTVAMLGILLGTLFFNIDAVRHALSEQLQLQSENAVSSLSLSLSQPGNQDAVARELLMSALFDTGQFDSILLMGADGNKLFERKMPAQPSARKMANAPAWFQQLIDLPQATAQRAISNGWSQVGNLEVAIDNRFAIETLWRNSLRMAGLVLVAGAGWAIFVGSLVRWFKRVLREEVANQVLRIGTAQSDSYHADKASVPELQAVSTAIQSAHQRVQKQEQAQAARIETLELETNSDSVTKLPNRKYFLNELNKALQSGARAQGHVLLVRQRDLQAINSSMARREADAWLLGVAEQMQTLLHDSDAENAQLARINGSDFALLLPAVLGPQAMHVIEQLRRTLQSLSVSVGSGQWSRWAFALTPFTSTDTAASVLARLDQAMMKAESAGHGDVEYAEHGSQSEAVLLAGEGHWQQLLVNALQTPGQLAVAMHPVTSASMLGSETWDEAALELHQANGKVLGAGLFLPAALRLGLSDDYDLKALQLVLQWLLEHPHNSTVLRVSLPSLEQAHFAQRVADTLAHAQVQHVLPHLIFELDAFALESTPESTLAFCAVVHKAGAQLGLRRLEQSPKALLHLPSLPLRYVKVGGFFAELSVDNAGALHLLEAILQTAQSQRAAVVVTDTVSPQAADWLREKGASLQVFAA